MKGSYTLAIVVCFIIILIVRSVYKSISDKNTKIKWPPHVSKCPDYWVLKKDNASECKPMTSDDTTKINSFNGSNTSAPAYTGSNLDEFRETVMLDRSFNHWDGISNIDNKN